MAELNPPQWLQGGSHPANTDRLLTQALVDTEGVVDLAGGDLLVSERAAGANMSVDVAAGAIIVAGTEAVTQGAYHAYNDAVANLTIAAADATNPRIDLVIAQVRDSFYSGGNDDWQLAVVTGTPAASPAEPAVPDNAHVLARVDVAALASSITDADITDRRAQALLRSTMTDETRSGASSSSTRTPIAGGALVDLATDTFTKPAGWNEYEIVATASIFFRNVGTTQTTRIAIDIDGNSSGEDSLGGSDTPRVMYKTHEVSGLTASSVTIKCQGRSTVQGDSDGAIIQWTARRTA